MEKEITKILDELSVSKELNGYQYLYTAIEMTAKEPRMVLDGIGKLYEAIAKKYGTTPRGVESAIYSLVEKAWFYGDIDMLNSYFGYTINSNRGRSTSSEFIAQIADHVLLETENDPMKIKVSNVLRQLGVPADIKGYGYLRTAILLTVKDSDILNSVGQTLYPSVAKEYQTTASSVASAIRKAIEIAWDRGDVDTLNCYFGYTIQNNRGKPTNSEFIAMIADNLRLKYRLF